MTEMRFKPSKLEDQFTLFFYSHEYDILEIAGILSGLLIIFVTNRFFFLSSIYYLLLIFGMVVCSLGFLLEYVIKFAKKKAIELEFGYFLQDLSREYKNTKNLSIAITNISNNNTYGSVDSEIRRIATRLSWGDDFYNALLSVNKEIRSPIIHHTLVLLDTFKTSEVPLNRVLLNISKDISIYREENLKKKYFKNLYYLAVVFFSIFLFVLVYFDLLIGRNFLWYSNTDLVTRIFIDNFLLYIGLLLSFFTAFVMHSIKGGKSIDFLKYIGVFFVIVIVLFQVFIPKPTADDVLIESINHMKEIGETNITLDRIISLESISSKYISENVGTDQIYFVNGKTRETCNLKCIEYTILVDDATFYNFNIIKNGDEFIIYYYVVIEL